MPRDPKPTFEEVYRTRRKFVWNAAKYYGVSYENREDVVQEVFMKVMRLLPDYQEEGRMTAWLRKIAWYHIREKFREAMRYEHYKGLYERGFAAPRNGADEALDRSEGARRVQAFMALLTEEKRDVFYLHHVEGLQLIEVAELLDVNINTLYSRNRGLWDAFCAFCDDDLRPEKQP